jgi:Putative DNA-binding domain
MAEPPKLSWTEADLDDLIGQSESIRREFKSGRLVDSNQESKWVEQLSKEVSAFANSEGGELFLGIDEDRKSKPRVATRIDGISIEMVPERLQQLIEGNVSPYLPGIRVNRVRLSRQQDRVVFIIQIPQGSTAYQANDGRYYGRSEFEAKYLPDHEVRLRMSRGRVARATVLARLGAVELGVERERRVRAVVQARPPVAERGLEVARRTPGGGIEWVKHDDALELAQARFLPDEVSFSFAFRNDGELTIRTPAVEFRESRNELLFNNDVMKVMRSPPMRIKLEDTIIYPGDEQELNNAKISFECKRDAVISGGDYKISWKVFLDNSPPSFGEIDLGALLQDARRQMADDPE